MMTLNLCLPDEVDALWDTLLPLFEDVNDRDYPVEHVHGMIRDGRAQLWYTCMHDTVGAVLVTSVHAYPARTVLQVWLCSGDLPEGWEGFLAMIERWACLQGCHAISVHGRPGWERKFKGMGFNKREVWLEKPLDPTHHTVQ